MSKRVEVLVLGKSGMLGSMVYEYLRANDDFEVDIPIPALSIEDPSEETITESLELPTSPEIPSTEEVPIESSEEAMPMVEPTPERDLEEPVEEATAFLSSLEFPSMEEEPVESPEPVQVEESPEEEMVSLSYIITIVSSPPYYETSTC